MSTDINVSSLNVGVEITASQAKVSSLNINTEVHIPYAKVAALALQVEVILATLDDIQEMIRRDYMPIVDLPKPTKGRTIEETVDNLYDITMRLRKELEFLLYNLDDKNVIKAKSVSADWVYAGNIQANQIDVTNGTITTAQIENLVVGDNVTMGEDAYISWSNVTDQPFIPDEYTDEDALAAIAFTYIDENGVWTPNVYATNISTLNGKISAAQIDTLSADQITAGTISLGGDVVMENADSSVYIDKDGIIVDGGKIVIGNQAGTASIIDAYGIDPRFFDYFKNLVYNSSFEVFDGSGVPLYWEGDGVSDGNSNFHGSYSLKLTAGQYMIQTDGGAINPDWYDRDITRVSFHRKLGQVKIQVYDETNDTYYTLTDEAGNTGSYITTAAVSNWQGSRVSVSFDPDEAGHTNCTSVKIKFTNVHGSQACYIDAVMVAPDFTGKWPQLYKDGPKSVGVLGSLQQIVISDTEPSDTSVLWYDIS